jgi:hypothetical protein
MSIYNQTATAGKSTEAPSEANHPGALVAIIDLGTHTETYTDKKTGNKRDSDVRKIYLVFELDEINKSTNANHVIGKEVTLTTSPNSALRKIMEGLRGKAYAEGEKIDIDKALGRSGLINVKRKTSQKGTEYAILESVSPLPKGMAAFKPTHELTIWEIGTNKPFPKHKWLPDSFLDGQFATLEKIMQASHEMRPGAAPAKSQGSNGTHTAQPPNEMADEPIPF